MNSELTDRALGLLRAREDWTAPELADELDVSIRTVHRLLARLRDRGLPIEASRGRGGGVRLGWSYGVDGLRLGHRDTLNVLLALAIAERLGAPLMTAGLPAVRQKLGMALPLKHRSALSVLRRRILVGAAASVSVFSTAGPVRAPVAGYVQDAFVSQRVLRLGYRDAAGTFTERHIEPHYLMLNPPCWYLLAWDRDRQAPRHFRLDRIASAANEEERFTLRTATRLMPEVEHHFDEI